MRLSWSSMSGLHPKAVVLTSHGRGDGRKGEMEDGHSRVEGGGGVVPQPVNVEPIAVVAWVKVSPGIFMVRGPTEVPRGCRS